MFNLLKQHKAKTLMLILFVGIGVFNLQMNTNSEAQIVLGVQKVQAYMEEDCGPKCKIVGRKWVPMKGLFGDFACCTQAPGKKCGTFKKPNVCK